MLKLCSIRNGKNGYCGPTENQDLTLQQENLKSLQPFLEEHGYNALPIYTEPLEGPRAQPELAQKFPLVFNSGARVTTDFRSQFHGIEGLSRHRPEPTVTLNTQDAVRRSIANGDRVVLSSPRGQVRMRALVTDDILPGAVDANMGGG